MHALRQPADDYVSGLQRRQSEKWTHLGIIQFIQLWILSNTHVSVCNNTINYQEEGEEEEGEELSADRSKDAEVGIWLTALWRRRDDPQRSTWGHSVIGNQGNNGEGWYLWDGFIYNKEHVDQQATSVLCHLQMAVTAQLPVCVCCPSAYSFNASPFPPLQPWQHRAPEPAEEAGRRSSAGLQDVCPFRYTNGAPTYTEGVLFLLQGLKITMWQHCDF